jgi:lipopolysaccharide transport system ATP-binding protein
LSDVSGLNNRAAISVRGLSKRYQLGEPMRIDGSFRELVMNAVTAPWRRARRLRGRAQDGWFWALRDVSFDVAPGEVVGVIGRNGAGKSTLLKILSRITEPTRGRVELRGRVASLLEVGTGFHPELTGRENVFLNGAILGMRRAEIHRKFDAIIDFAEVGPFVDTAVKHYSTGMYLRLAFAVAAHLDGEILLVDEVLAVGDVGFQKKCLGKMQDVSRGGRAVLFVTHNMMAASTLCQRGLVIDAGELRVNAAVQEAIKVYLSESTIAGADVWDVADLKRDRGYGELVQVTRIEALPARAGGFRFGEALRFRVHFRSRTTLQALSIGAGIDDILGHRLATFESNEVHFTLDVEKDREYRVELQVPQPYLNPGRYFLSVSLFSGRTYFDLLFHVAAFDVTSVDAATGTYFEPIAGAGSLRLPYRWTCADVASEARSAVTASTRS